MPMLIVGRRTAALFEYSSSRGEVLEDVEVVADAATVRRLASFFADAASQMDEKGDRFDHIHLLDAWKAHGANIPDVVISRHVMDIVICDGICNLCTRSVKFILKHEAAPHFRFAPIQSAAGMRLLTEHGFDPADPSTFVLISDGKVYTKSAAAIRIARHFKGLWRLAGLFWLVPRPLRDWMYDVVARSRYQWFGKTDACMVPTPQVAGRFLRD